MNKRVVYVEEINKAFKKYESSLKVNNVYRGMREYKINEEIIIKIEKYVTNAMRLWRYLKLLVTLSVHLFEDHTIYQMENIIDDLADKSEDHIKWPHQDGMRMPGTYSRITHFCQSQTPQVQLCEMLSNLILKTKLNMLKKLQVEI